VHVGSAGKQAQSSYSTRPGPQNKRIAGALNQARLLYWCTCPDVELSSLYVVWAFSCLAGCHEVNGIYPQHRVQYATVATQRVETVRNSLVSGLTSLHWLHQLAFTSAQAGDKRHDNHVSHAMGAQESQQQRFCYGGDSGECSQTEASLVKVRSAPPPHASH
jgi:hypothetical protein